MGVPGILLLFAGVHFLDQVFQHAQIVQRMDFAGDGLGQRAHPGPAQRVGRQQAGLGLEFVQVFDDGHGLRQPRAVVGDQQRHQPVGGQTGVVVLQLFAAHQVHGDIVVVHALERQRDAHAERGRGAEVVVKLHGETIW